MLGQAYELEYAEYELGTLTIRFRIRRGDAVKDDLDRALSIQGYRPDIHLHVEI